jgi:hypothetical protein
MNEAKCNKASRNHTIITVLGITPLVLLMLVSIASSAQSSHAPNSSDDFAQKFLEKN